jgi:hypothetical protein
MIMITMTLITGINIRAVINIIKRRILGKVFSGTILLGYPIVPNKIVV